MKACLGTVQFGLDYGINGKTKPPMDYSVRCLDYATQNGVTAIDTAAAYGNAESIVGAFLHRKTVPRSHLYISSKLLPNVLDDCTPDLYRSIIRNHLIETLKTLNTDYLDAYMFHSSRYAYEGVMLDALAAVKREGLAVHVGVSVYDPEEAMAAMRHPEIDIIQVPYSVFDHRMKDAGVFEALENNACDVHARSAFLQGLLLMDEKAVPKYLEKAKPILRKVDAICKAEGVSRIELALAYVRKEQSISHLVFGVHTLEQLQEDIDLFDKAISDELLEYVEQECRDIDAEIVIPSLWKKEKS